jgi:DNA-binding MarR family transcriptional regulator
MGTLFPVGTEELADAVQAVSRRLRHGAKERLAPHGLTPGQSRALSVLAREDRPVRMAELADLLRVVPRSATGVVDGLVEAGLVRRDTDPDDRRSVLVSLTDGGRARLEDIAAARRATAEDLFGALPEEDRRRLLRLLERVLDQA